MTRVLVTGATGFIGSQLLTHLGNHSLRSAARSITPSVNESVRETIKFDLDSTDKDYDQLLQDIEVVIHLAGIAHTKSASTDDYRRNLLGTSALAEAAALRGVKRFIFLSTIKVHGQSTTGVGGLYSAINELSPTCPPDSYAFSKLQAEHAIISTCTAHNMEYVILRPPLVYGQGVKANFLQLLRAASWNLPMPFLGINNRRSFIYVQNLCNIIKLCVDEPAAANQIYVLKDYDDSTAGLFTKLSLGFGHHPRVFNVAPAFLKWFGKVLYLDSSISRLTESLLVDNTKLTTQLGWSAPSTTDLAISKTIDWFRNRHGNR